ncbi:HAD family hydrolase [Actinotalea sp. M2MS4P-6]|uniref:HAD family hydrolase n=1 Tax=Actinotalea sp. M2MS4P-6 TaxID=2983762 RepID=UPI0021E40AF2|nr:HAD family hydrolase [Actinotalea sp. M2MS4P-6]MCV2394011.1 HAD family hydrolase [Actinotalea sp. M2MS4P-6]
MTTVDGVLLDVDDTLVDTRAAFEAALAEVARVYLPEVGEARLAEVVMTWRADSGGWYRRYTRGEVGYVEQRRARANELHDLFGGPALDGDGFARWDAVFEAAFEDAWRAHDDAVATVAALVGRGLAVGALTNAAVGYQTRKLERAGLEQVPVLVGMDTLGVGKPDERVFHEACRRLGTDPARTVYVGDELDIDAVAAVRAGLVGVWLDRPGTRRHVVPEAEIAAARSVGVHVVATLDALDGVV